VKKCKLLYSLITCIFFAVTGNKSFKKIQARIDCARALSIQRLLEWKSHNDRYSMSVHFCRGVCYCPQTRVPGERFKIVWSSSWCMFHQLWCSEYSSMKSKTGNENVVYLLDRLASCPLVHLPACPLARLPACPLARLQVGNMFRLREINISILFSWCYKCKYYFKIKPENKYAWICCKMSRSSLVFFKNDLHNDLL